jgi:hypothetical protein
MTEHFEEREGDRLCAVLTAASAPTIHQPEQVPVIPALEHRSERRNGVRLPE